MISSKYDRQADALDLKLASRKIARTVEIDSGTLADVDDAGQLVGVEVIRPGRDWPVDNILTRFDISDRQARSCAEHRKTSRRGSGGRGGAVAGAIVIIGTAVAIGARSALRALSRIPVR